jgi:hypothetical protein
VTPFVYNANSSAAAASIACGIGLILLSIRRGAIEQRYARWQKMII